MADENQKHQPEPGAGDVTIMLEGKEHTMSPSLGACMAISKFAGGTQNAIRRCLACDFEAICEIISIGTGYTSLNERKLIQEAVFKQGLISVAAECVLFIRAINNGGKLPNDDEDEGGEGDPDAPLSLSESSTTA